MTAPIDHEDWRKSHLATARAIENQALRAGYPSPPPSLLKLARACRVTLEKEGDK